MKPTTRFTLSLAAALAMTGCVLASPARAETQPLEQRYELNIPKQSLESALQELSRQTGLQIARFSDAIDGSAMVGPVSGTQSAGQALKALLDPRGLSFRLVSDRTIAVVDPKKAPPKVSAEQASPVLRLTQSGSPAPAVDAQAATAAAEPVDELAKGIPEILVQGTKTLNIDIKRSRDDVQPYVIFDRETIVNSGATNLEDFLKQRLSMESTALSESQTSSFLGTRSSVNLRGLGTDETLILIDGRRMAGVAVVGGVYQPDINGVPLNAIERIEILPTSASGIYGGSATGGVVNIVMRRDYAGVETKLTYDNTFSSDTARRRVDINAGMSLEDGKTTLLMVGSYSDGNRLLMRDRDFMTENQQRILANNPAFIYNNGVPPVGGTANIRSSNGSNLVLDGGTALNSPRTHLPAGYAGPQSDGGLALVANAGQYNLDLADTINSGLRPMLNVPEVQSLMFTVRRDFTPRLSAFVEASGSNNIGSYAQASIANGFRLPADHIYNPFTTEIRVTTPLTGLEGALEVTSQHRRLVGGLIGKLPHDWMMSLDVSLDRSRYDSRSVGSTNTAVNNAVIGIPASGGNPAVAPTLNVMRDVNAFPIDFSQFIDSETLRLPTHATMRDYMVRASGPVFSLPSGRVNLSALLERREETFKPSLSVTDGGTPSGTPEKQFQEVNSMYLEATVPVVSARTAFPGVRELELQLAGRWDEYKTSGTNMVTPFDPLTRAENEISSRNTTLGLRYVPIADLMLRASYGTGFLPPHVNQLVSRSMGAFPGSFFVDPVRGGEVPGLVEILDSGNDDLDPERSKTLSMGLVFTPRLVDGLRVSVDWYRIEKRDAFASPDFFDVLADEGRPGGTRYPGRVIRGAPDGHPSGVGPVIALDTSLMNVSKAEVEGYDLAVDYRLATGRFGSVDLFSSGTITKHHLSQTFFDSPVQDNVGMVTSQGAAITGANYPLKFRGNLGVVWNIAQWTAGWNTRYLDDYLLDGNRVFSGGGAANVALTQGNGGRVPSQTYHDLFVTYRIGSQAPLSGLLSDTEWQLGVRNVFNTKPPFDVSNTGGYYSGFGDPRLASYYLSMKKGF